MEKTLQIINQLQAGGLIENYALGGAVAAIFYIEPVLTYDLDVFIFLPEQAQSLISLSPIYDYLRKKEYQVEREHIAIEGVPVQFIPVYNNLVEEAEVDMVHLSKILEKHGLSENWQNFRSRYYGK